jgi:hypothetical protein
MPQKSPPELVAQLRRLLNAYGEEVYRAAQAEAREMPARQRGRRPIADDPSLLDMAVILLDRRISVKAASLEVAATIADSHSRDSTAKRLSRKFIDNRSDYMARAQRLRRPSAAFPVDTRRALVELTESFRSQAGGNLHSLHELGRLLVDSPRRDFNFFRRVLDLWHPALPPAPPAGRK